MFNLILLVASAAFGTAAPDAQTLEAMVAECPVVDPKAAPRYNHTLCLRDIGALGPAAESAGPKVVEHLHSQDLDDRAYAAVTLGMIGYRAAVPELVDAAGGDDWRTALASVRSLGWLRAVEARAAVERVAQTHPLAVVRREAADALAAIDGLRASAPDYDAETYAQTHPFALVFHPYGRTRNPCARGPWRWNDQTIFLTPETAGGFDAPNLRTMPTPEMRGIAAEFDVEDGLLIGTNRGEWGGELFFQRGGKAPQKLHDENIVTIASGPDGIVAIGGVAHIAIDYGFVIAVERSAGGRYTARARLPLPSEPLGAVRVDASTLLISTGAANFVLRPGWRLEDAGCAGPQTSAE